MKLDDRRDLPALNGPDPVEQSHRCSRAADDQVGGLSGGAKLPHACIAAGFAQLFAIRLDDQRVMKEPGRLVATEHSG